MCPPLSGLNRMKNIEWPYQKIKSKLLAQEQRVGGTQGLSQILTGSDCYFYTTPFRASFSHPMTMYHGSGFEGANTKP